MNFSEAEREQYESHLKCLHIEANTIKKAENKAREEVREESIKITAINMLSKNLGISLISKITSLTESEIKSLKN